METQTSGAQASPSMPAALRTASLDERRWESLNDAWGDLLAASSADPLFMSWDWLRLWWSHFRAAQGEVLACIVVYDGDALIGAAPMVISTVRRRPALRLKSAQCVGFRLHEARGMLSEYQDVLALPGREREVRAAVLTELMVRQRCREVVFGWCRTADQWAHAARGLGPHRVRLVSPQTSYQADLSQGFQRYIGSLGTSTRRSVYHLRRRLEEIGSVDFHVASAAESHAALDELNHLHALRWGQPLFSGNTLAFNRALAQAWTAQGRLLISRLRIRGQSVSALYDIRCGDRQYNLQMGFDPAFSPKISLGLLHLGYAMEHAANQGVRTYDFLGGGGKNVDYKSKLANEQLSLHTAQVLRGWWPTTMSLAFDGVRHAAAALRGG